MSSASVSYLICATPRSGSTLLCELLAASGVAGTPDSFFMDPVDPVWRAEWKLPAPELSRTKGYAAAYLDAAIAAGSGGTGVFGLRLMQKDLAGLLALIGAVHPGAGSDQARLAAAFGRVSYLHLTRSDKLGQAISLVKAEQTGLWHRAADGRELERLSPPQAPEYDFARIRAKLAALEAYDAAWRAWFAAQGITPMTVAYEELAARPTETIAAICRALGVTLPASVHLVPEVARLADGLNRDWAARFRADSAALG
ncbi:Stf0 family sulfotransferase [Paracoccus aminophilus]|uniref:Sulphotransferase Stf0 domain-containing protein n=1 Tax=Paracoccus aminophilus JCM 7686 TaxID=1367847 RepID=S5Y5C5_PARAH|nr:Stf0 family sulfotransferase [Paracoccus aminophilus]AGT10920.1 hypothetical protein JCM7686_pAMI4p230 [Paracoccus aminophilus JCM 7686]